MTLLTPAVLHSSALEHIKNESPKFHRKYVFHFAIMQGLWGVILAVLCFATMLLPRAASFRVIGEDILKHANFTSLSIKGDLLSINMMPPIWSFSLSDSPRSKYEFVVDSTGQMNKFYWDDRIEKGEIKQINGISVTKNWLMIKNGTDIKKIPYTKLTMGRDINLTKVELSSLLLRYTDKGILFRYFLYFLPFVFVFTAVLGALAQGIYTLLVGYILYFATRKYTRIVKQCFNIASGLYVAWAYVLVLTLVAQRVLQLNSLDISSFLFVVKLVSFVTIVMVGYLSFRIEEVSNQAIANPKVSKKVR